jgi:toxin ParE1/3/4
MATIAWTKEAQRWLQDIFEFISADNPLAAARTVQGIYERTQVLTSLPEIGHRSALNANLPTLRQRQR